MENLKGIRLGWKGLPGTSTLAYFKIRFYSTGPSWACNNNLFTVVIYYFLQASVLVPDKPFQPCFMIDGKAGAYPSAAPYRCSAVG